uniref:Uncharacterized protein n=1 Tax=Ciona intestinalis TaxID=7719 RepID=H2XM21_CIOIN
LCFIQTHHLNITVSKLKCVYLVDPQINFGAFQGPAGDFSFRPNYHSRLSGSCKN